MISNRKSATRLSLLLATAFFVGLSGSEAQTEAPAAPKTAAQVFKNIQVLKDIPADQLYPTMHFISASLHVDCLHCHVEGAREKDDKREKRTARKMVQMVQAINRDTFGGSPIVTCNTCHRGSLDPVGTPSLEEAQPKPALPVSPTADELIARYLQALGGADAIQRISSRWEQSTLTLVTEGRESPMEEFVKLPDKRLDVTHGSSGDTFSAYDGALAWTGRAGAAAVSMSPAAADYFKFDADLHLPLHLKQMFTSLEVTAEQIDGRPVWALLALREGQPPLTFYFDSRSGLLVRVVRYLRTPLGPNPMQIDYADYRAQDGVKVPFHRNYIQSGYLATVVVHQVQQNIPLDDAKFSPPPK